VSIRHVFGNTTGERFKSQEGMGLHDSVRRFGTSLLHRLAPEPTGEHPPRSRTTEAETNQVTVN
jgi:hypothetical protein